MTSASNRETAMSPRSFDYEAFVDDIARLIGEGANFTVDDKHHDSGRFRAWRHEVQDAIARIRRLKYPINFGIENRVFRTMGYGANAEKDLYSFERDFNDTYNELVLIINNYRRYGDPKGAPKANHPVLAESNRMAPANYSAPDTTSLKAEIPAEKITLKWIQEHVSAGWLWTIALGLVAALAVAFSLGMTLAGTKAGREVLTWFEPASK